MSAGMWLFLLFIVLGVGFCMGRLSGLRTGRLHEQRVVEDVVEETVVLVAGDIERQLNDLGIRVSLVKPKHPEGENVAPEDRSWTGEPTNDVAARPAGTRLHWTESRQHDA